MESTQAVQREAVRTIRPRLDLWESERAWQAHVDLPGAASSRIEVAFDKGELRVRAPIEPLELPAGSRWLARERRPGRYELHLTVAPLVDASRIEADHKDGVLTLTLPKLAAAQAQRIAVRSGPS